MRALPGLLDRRESLGPSSATHNRCSDLNTRETTPTAAPGVDEWIADESQAAELADGTATEE